MGRRLLPWLACGIGAAIVARRRGGSAGRWLVGGVLLGPLALPLSLLAGPVRTPPECCCRPEEIEGEDAGGELELGETPVPPAFRG